MVICVSLHHLQVIWWAQISKGIPPKYAYYQFTFRKYTNLPRNIISKSFWHTSWFKNKQHFTQQKCQCQQTMHFPATFCLPTNFFCWHQYLRDISRDPTHRRKSSEALHGGTATGRMGLLAIEWLPRLQVFTEMSLCMITRRPWRPLLGTGGFTYIYIYVIFTPIDGEDFSTQFDSWAAYFSDGWWIQNHQLDTSVFSEKGWPVFWKVPSTQVSHRSLRGFWKGPLQDAGVWMMAKWGWGK